MCRTRRRTRRRSFSRGSSRRRCGQRRRSLSLLRSAWTVLRRNATISQIGISILRRKSPRIEVKETIDILIQLEFLIAAYLFCQTSVWTEAPIHNVFAHGVLIEPTVFEALPRVLFDDRFYAESRVGDVVMSCIHAGALIGGLARTHGREAARAVIRTRQSR